MKKTNETKKEIKKIVVKGKLIKCVRKAKTFKGVTGKEKLYITLAEVELTEEQENALKDCFKDSGTKFTPEWVKNFEGYVNLSTVYDLPFSDCTTGKRGESLEDYIADSFEKWCGASVGISINLKDGAVYPKAIVIYGEGKEFDPFADFDEEELPFK